MTPIKKSLLLFPCLFPALPARGAPRPQHEGDQSFDFVMNLRAVVSPQITDAAPIVLAAQLPVYMIMCVSGCLDGRALRYTLSAAWSRSFSF